MFRCFRIWFAFVAAFVSFVAPAGPAHADNVTPALAEAKQFIDRGTPEKAIELVNRTLSSGQIPSDLAAKAIMVRARAQEERGKYAYALADYNQALWMEGLPDADKRRAETGRDRILSELGVSGDDGRKKGGKQPVKQRVRSSNAAAAGWGSEIQTAKTEVRTSASEQRTGGFGSFFEGLFGFSQKTAEPEKAAQPARRSNIAARQAAQIRTAQIIEQANNASTADADPSSVAASVSAPSSEPSGDFAIQFAALRSEDSAIYEVDRIEKRFGQWLGGRTPSITIRPTSEGGTLYKIIAEPYQRQEGTAVCELLKTKGSDCMLISR